MQKLILIHILDLNRSGAGKEQKGIWGNLKDVRNSIKALKGEMEIEMETLKSSVR